MAKKARRIQERLYRSLEEISSVQGRDDPSPPDTRVEPEYGELDGGEDTAGIAFVQGQAVGLYQDSSRLPRLKRFRFQLLHQWLIHNFAPCKAADVGGGKGLLSYLLIQSGWQSTVIDPAPQPLPDKYKDILSGKRVKIDPAVRVPNLAAEFDPLQAQGFDLLIGMHAHGCNAKIIDAAAEYGCGFVLFPCCVIDEPFVPAPGVHWLESLAEYAMQCGHDVKPFRLNFKGQNIGLWASRMSRVNNMLD